MTRKYFHSTFLAAGFILVAFFASALAQAPAHRPTRRPVVRADIAAFRDRVGQILSAPEVSRGYWGLFVQDADTGEVLFAQNADR